MAPPPSDNASPSVSKKGDSNGIDDDAKKKDENRKKKKLRSLYENNVEEKSIDVGSRTPSEQPQSQSQSDSQPQPQTKSQSDSHSSSSRRKSVIPKKQQQQQQQLQSNKQQEQEVEKVQEQKSSCSSSPNKSQRTETPTSPPAVSSNYSGQGIDAHPFARGSVIEVLCSSKVANSKEHGRLKSAKSDRKSNGDGDDCDESDESDDSDEFMFDEEEEEEEDGMEGESDVVGIENGPSKPATVTVSKSTKSPKASKKQAPAAAAEGSSAVRLADIIDRAASSTPQHPKPSCRWRYYIHYRDYNRRMDEWITGDTDARIVSPPSVGNAKVRAMKRKKKRERDETAPKKKKKKAAEDRRKATDAALAAGGADGGWMDGGSPGSRPVSQRASSRRASAAIASAVQGAAGASPSPVAVSSPSSVRSPSSAAAAEKDSLGTPSVLPSSSVGAAASLTLAAAGGVAGGASSAGASSSTLLSPEEQERLRSSRRRRKSSRSASIDHDSASSSNNHAHATGTLTRSSSLVFLPEEEQIKDKIVTVAAQELDEHEGLDEASLREHEEVTKVKNVAEVQLGRYRMDTWYFSPIPKEILSNNNMVDVLYVCEFSLQFFPRKQELLRFQNKELTSRNRRHPPGNEIYRNGNLSMFEVDGLEERIYCQNLCYIAKLFLDHKTLYFDVDPFLFYVLCEVDDRGFHPVGYYSKEKYSDVGYNLACILTFPCHQRKGYGRFLIDFSYELSKIEEKVGSPEKPMSDLGQQAYKPYWTSTIIDFLLNQSNENNMSIMEISKRTSIMAEDIIFTLNMLGLLKYINGVYFITAEQRLLEELAKKHPVKDPRVDPLKLHWTPYLTDVKRDKFSIHSKKPCVTEEEANLRGNGGF